MSYPLCEKYGLKVKEDYCMEPNGNHYHRDNIKASEVEQLLASGVAVEGKLKDGRPYEISAIHFDSTDTHQGLLIGYKPIEKEQPVSVDEIISLINKLRAPMVEVVEKQCADLINRLKATKEMK